MRFSNDTSGVSTYGEYYQEAEHQYRVFAIRDPLTDLCFDSASEREQVQALPSFQATLPPLD